MLTRLDPLTYAIDPMRRAIFDRLDTGTTTTLAAGVTWWGWRVPTPVELAMVGVMGLAMLAVAIAAFNTTD